MGKEDMIRRLLREIEAEFSYDLDYGRMDRKQFDKVIDGEWLRLKEKSYSEIEELFYTAAA